MTRRSLRLRGGRSSASLKRTHATSLDDDGTVLASPMPSDKCSVNPGGEVVGSAAPRGSRSATNRSIGREGDTTEQVQQPPAFKRLKPDVSRSEREPSDGRRDQPAESEHDVQNAEPLNGLLADDYEYGEEPTGIYPHDADEILMIAACMYIGMPTLAICIAAVMHHAEESDLDEVSLVQRTYDVPSTSS
jgi:hypothetical protein